MNKLKEKKKESNNIRTRNNKTQQAETITSSHFKKQLLGENILAPIKLKLK